MSYCCCYIAPIKKTDLEDYRQTSKEVGDLLLQLGALEIHAFVTDDDAEYPMKSFGMVVNCRPDETLIMGWSIWSSKIDLDRCNAELTRNPREIASQANFDTRRLVMANFVPLAA